MTVGTTRKIVTNIVTSTSDIWVRIILEFFIAIVTQFKITMGSIGSAYRIIQACHYVLNVQNDLSSLCNQFCCEKEIRKTRYNV